MDDPDRAVLMLSVSRALLEEATYNYGVARLIRDDLHTQLDRALDAKLERQANARNL